MATIYAAALVSLLGWRLWRFTIWPLFHPEEPRELPYWIPCTFDQIIVALALLFD
jgi:hypothetical protein